VNRKQSVIFLLGLLSLNEAYGGNFCALWFRNGNVQSHPTANRFVNVESAGTADIQSPFFRLFREGRRSYVNSNSPQARFDGSDSAIIETLVTRSQLKLDEINDRIEKSIEALISKIELQILQDQNLDTNYIVSRVYDALSFLYKRYLNQGPERSLNVERYQTEDYDSSTRTTHFVQMVNGEVLSHFQAQSSTDPVTQPLNFERHFNTKSFIKRDSGELVFELGRLELIKPSHITRSSREALERMDITRPILLRRTIQKMLSWLNHDVAATRVFFNVNDKVKRVLEDTIYPIKFSKTFDIYAYPGAPREWIIECDSELLRQIEVQLMDQILEHHFNRDLARLFFLGANKEAVPELTWHWTFWPNEISSLVKTRLGSSAFYQHFQKFFEAFTQQLRALIEEVGMAEQTTERSVFDPPTLLSANFWDVADKNGR